MTRILLHAMKPRIVAALLLAALCAAGCATNRDYETVRVALDLSCPPETLTAWRAAQADSAGCATTNGGLWGPHAPKWARDFAAGRPDSALVVASIDTLYHHDVQVTVGVADTMVGYAAPADSMTLTFTAPRYGSLGCEADTSRPLHGGQRVYLLRLKGQVSNYWPGMMQTVAGMDSVRLLTRPDTVWRAAVQPGVRCSVRVGAGEYVAETQGQRCAAWRIVRVGQ